MSLVGTDWKSVPRVGKTGVVNSSAAAFDYYVREGAWSLDRKRPRSDDPCLHQEHGNMPSWASDNPRLFWAATDKYSRANAALHFHFRIEVPREFDQQQAIEYGRSVLAGIQRDYGPLPYSMTLQPGGRAAPGDLPDDLVAGHPGWKNPHIDLMLSQHQLDGIERGPEQFFRKSDSKKPARGGTKKARLGENTNPEKYRRLAVDLANEALEKAGRPERTTYSSHTSELAAAYEAAGDEVAAIRALRPPVPRCPAGYMRQAKRLAKQGLSESEIDLRLIKYAPWRRYRAACFAIERVEHAIADFQKALAETRAPVAETLELIERGRIQLHHQSNYIKTADLDKKQQYKLMLLSERYEFQLAAELGPKLKLVDVKNQDSVRIVLKSGERIIDTGDQISTASDTEAAAAAAVAMARARGWQSIHIAGSDEFKTAVRAEWQRQVVLAPNMPTPLKNEVLNPVKQSRRGLTATIAAVESDEWMRAALESDTWAMDVHHALGNVTRVGAPSGESRTIETVTGRVVDHGTSINIEDDRDPAATAAGAVRLLAMRGADELTVTGPEEIRRAAWLAGAAAGIEVHGYAPTADDLEQAQRLRAEREADTDYDYAPMIGL